LEVVVAAALATGKATFVPEVMFGETDRGDEEKLAQGRAGLP
jgi:hypothetical protein